MLAWHRDLIRFRRSQPDLTDGRLGAVDVTVDEGAGHLLVRRGVVTIAVNLGDAPWDLPPDLGELCGFSTPELASNEKSLKLPANAVAILTSSLV